MPYFPHTPESLLPRSDSKNPAATCKGLTSNGRPCRRAIQKSPQSSPNSSPQRGSSPEAFCWQHREQSVHATPAPASPQGLQYTSIQERSSIDTLVDRLGLLEVERNKEQKKPHRKSATRPEPEKVLQSIETSPPQHERRPRPKKKSKLGFFCCVGEADEYKRAPRPTHTNNGRRTTMPVPAKQKNKMSLNKPPQHGLDRPQINRDPSSRTGEFLSLIPKTASPQTTALLLAELAKPISEFDDHGFIYMFWLTPESLPSDVPNQTAPSLLAPPSQPPRGQRRPSDVLSTFSTNLPNSSNANKKTILLKIGRAQNVQRRLNQWTQQCGYNLSLIRYYPYQATTPSTSNENDPPRTPRKVPNAHKVERLIHIELSGSGMRPQGAGKCDVCGREHREWFSVEGSRDGVKGVDEVVRRWVEWGERQV